MPHDLDDECALQDRAPAVGHLLDRLIYDKIMAKLDDNWIDQLLAKDMRERVERIASLAMGKLLTELPQRERFSGDEDRYSSDEDRLRQDG